MTYRLGIDVGGTFTDLLLVDEKTGRTWSVKLPSTPKDQSVGVLRGLTRICRQARIDPQAIEHVMHGTTVATNTVLTSSGARWARDDKRLYGVVLQNGRVDWKATAAPRFSAFTRARTRPAQGRQRRRA